MCRENRYFFTELVIFKNKNKMKIALVHDYLLNYGGAERVLFALQKIYPEAKIFTLLYDKKLSKYFPEEKVKTSSLNSLPNFIKKHHKFLLPFFPMAIESIDFSGYDVVISSSSVFAKGIVTRPETTHICYCHSPSRFLWDYNERYLNDEGFNKFLIPFIKFIIHRVRIWDRSSAERVDFWITNSETTKKRVQKYYKKDSELIYPPVESLICESGFVKEKDYFLVVSRLSPYKKIDVIIEAFNELKLPLVIVGGGRDRKRLEKISKNNIKFTGFISDEKLGTYLKNCKVFIMAQEEDFGLAPLEAMRFKKPVLAYKKGGACEWMIDGMTGVFFEKQTKESLKKGLEKILKNMKNYDKEFIRKHSEKFSFENFKYNIKKFVKEKESSNRNFIEN